MDKVLVLVHAFPLGVRMWDDLTVPDGWLVITPSLPGFDGAPLPPMDSSSIDDYARAVLAQLDARHVSSFVVGGVSMGGYVAMALWRLAADRCRGVILADTRAGADSEAARAGREAMLALVHTRGASAVADEMLPKLLGATTRTHRPDLALRVRQMIESQTPAGIAAAIRRLRDRPDSFPTLATMTVPALVVVGEEDEITPPAESELMRNALPLATLLRIPEVGHLANLEAPELFNLAVRAFLTALV
jgi:pimeloyl-ACP methyl ester carboxylesterase